MFRSIALCAGVLLAVMAPAHAADPAGEAVKILETARAQGETGARFLKVRGPVFTGDVITTDQKGQAQLRFADDTRMVVGPNARLTIDSFVFAGRANARQVAIGAVRGAFRFITGRSDKGAYIINFPTGTIGVRGTEFDLTIEEDGTTLIALYDGGLRVCDRSEPRRRCIDLDESCSVVEINPAGQFQWINNVYERTEMFDTDFPYAFRQRWLEPSWRVRSSGCEIRDPTGAPPNTDAPSPDAASKPIIIT